MFEWFGPDKMIISNNSEIKVVTRPSKSILLFNILKESHGGEYKCKVTLETEVMNGTKTITVQGIRSR